MPCHWSPLLFPGTCVTCRMPYHAIGLQVLSAQPIPRKAEDFPRSGKYPKHVPVPTYIAYVCFTSLFICQKKKQPFKSEFIEKHMYVKVV